MNGALIAVLCCIWQMVMDTVWAPLVKTVNVNVVWLLYLESNAHASLRYKLCVKLVHLIAVPAQVAIHPDCWPSALG